MGRNTVLLLEDDESLRSVLRELLEDEGYAVTGVESVEAAWRAIEAELPSVVLADVEVGPGESGLDLTRALRARSRTSTLPVVLVTGGSYPAKIGCADAVVRKPFEIDVLLRCLRTVAGLDETRPRV